ncbi:hypothetical protein ABLE53_07190 [Nocardioides sp. KR10-350]
MHEFAGRGFVDVFCYRDQLGASLGDSHHDVDIVLAVACQAVDLVHDDVVDVMVDLQPRQHGLQLRPVGRPGRFAGIDILGDDFRAELSRLAVAGLTLRRDGKAFGLPSLARLALRRDPQIERCAPLLTGWCRGRN